MDRFLSSQRVLYNDFSAFVQRISKRIKEGAEQMARNNNRPLIYLRSPKESKEEFVRDIVEQDQITAGLVCILSCVEPCRSFSIRGDRSTKQTKLVAEKRQCQHLYFYFLDHEFGLMHVRLQTWLPLTIQVCINGREYLARQMLQAGIKYTQADTESAKQVPMAALAQRYRGYTPACAVVACG